MANPLMNQMNNNNNILGMLKQFNQFKSMMAGKDPNIVLKELTESGRFNQSQIEQAKQLANQFKFLLK